MHDSSRRLQECLADMYEPEWYGKEEVDSIAEVTIIISAKRLQPVLVVFGFSDKHNVFITGKWISDSLGGGWCHW